MSLVKDRSCVTPPPTLYNQTTLAKKVNSSHIGWHIDYPDVFRGFPQLIQACQDARVLGWHIDYPDFFMSFLSSSRQMPGWENSQLTHRLCWLFRGFPRLLQANSKVWEISADTSTILTFFVGFLSSSRRMRGCEICGSQGGTGEDSCPLGCDAGSHHNLEDDGSAFLRNVREH